MVALVGTLHWLAPECFLDGNITKATDMWAMGMTAYEIFTNGRIPLRELDASSLGQSLQDGVRPDRNVDPPIPQTPWVMMERCWAYEPLERPSFAQLSLILGVFQDTDIDSLQDASLGFADENWVGSELSKWPGLAEKLVGILTLVLFVPSLFSHLTILQLNTRNWSGPVNRNHKHYFLIALRTGARTSHLSASGACRIGEKCGG